MKTAMLGLAALTLTLSAGAQTYQMDLPNGGKVVMTHERPCPLGEDVKSLYRVDGYDLSGTRLVYGCGDFKGDKVMVAWVTDAPDSMGVYARSKFRRIALPGAYTPPN